YTRSLLLLLMLASFVQGQQPASPLPGSAGRRDGQSPVTPQKVDEVGEGEVVRITANLVSVPVTVINRQGQYVLDLHQNDFRVYEDGVEQIIAHFSNVDRPFSVVLLIDTSGSTAPFLNQIKEAAKAFVEQLRPSDTVRPVYFHGEIKSLTKVGTNDPRLLSAAIDKMEPGPILMGTRLYDAVDFAMRVLKPESARKAVILFTDGENTWGKATMKSTLQEAEESDIIMYTLQYGDMPPDKYLQRLADKTGGRYFKAGDTSMIRQSFAGVADELRRQYMIGYYPKEPAQRGQERKIKVKVNRERVAVRARRFYTYNR
ncbi:MAG: VWA domain-containing protein, partial [Pyrinomonadaceae bacterium]